MSSPARRPRILLAGGDDRSMLAAARSLSRHEVPFVVAGPGPRGMVGVSRYVRSRLVERGPSARSEPEAYAGYVLDLVRRHGVDVVLPLTDSAMLACDRHRDAIQREARLAAPPSPAVRNVLDKKANLATARRLGIPCPPQFELESREQLPQLVEALGFPMVLKNPGPSIDGRRPTFAFSWLVAHDRAELGGFLEQYCSVGEYPIFQRFVTGTVHNVCCFATGGQIVAAHEYQGLRRLRGLSVLRQISPLTPELHRYAEAMFAELRWEGAGQLAFFVSDGDARYMETNGRLWASLEGSIAAGWDFAHWTYGYFALGQRPEPPAPTQGCGLRWRWHYGELEVLLRSLAGATEPAWEGRTRSRAVVDYVSGFRPRVKADVFRPDDPLPEIVDHWRGTKVIALTTLRALKHRIRPRRPGPTD